MTKKQKKMLVRILITAVMLIALKFIPITDIPQLIAYLAAYAVIGYDILKKAGHGIANGRAFDENFLMALATLGAFAVAIWTKSGDYVEGIAVMLFYQIGELPEHIRRRGKIAACQKLCVQRRVVAPLTVMMRQDKFLHIARSFSVLEISFAHSDTSAKIA